MESGQTTAFLIGVAVAAIIAAVLYGLKESRQARINIFVGGKDAPGEPISAALMGTSTAYFKRMNAPIELELVVQLAVYVFPELDRRSVLAIERSLVSPTTNRHDIQRLLSAAIARRNSLSAILRSARQHDLSAHNDQQRLFTTLCKVISNAGVRSRTITERLKAVAKSLGLDENYSTGLLRTRGLLA